MTQTTIWAIVGILLVSAEIVSGTFFLLFFGVSALLVSGLRFVGLDSLYLEIAIFCFFSLTFTLFFRKRLASALLSRDSWEGEQTFVTQKQLISGVDTSVQYQGSTWTAINDGPDLITQGSRVKIVRKDGNKIFVLKA